jgi:hypothetical protein
MNLFFSSGAAPQRADLISDDATGGLSLILFKDVQEDSDGQGMGEFDE